MLVKPIVRSIVRHIAGNPVRASGSGFSPVSLFADGSKGVVYDNNDLSSFFLDSALTTPATVNGLVGGQLDKSGNGFHRTQATTGSKPVLRGTPTGANLVTNGDFATDTVWTKQVGWTISGGTANVNSSAAGTTLISQGATVIGKVYRVTYTISSYTSGGVNAFVGGVSGAVRSAAGTYVEYITATATSGFGIVGQSTTTVASVDNVEFFDVSAGSVTAPYGLQYDGVDDFLQTAAVDFTATDKMFVCAGVRKLSDAATAMLVEHSTIATSNNGTFYITAPESGGASKFAGISRGTLGTSFGTTSTTYNAPYLGVVSLQGDIAGDSMIVRINGTQVASSVLDQGTGNYGNYALYFGRRAGTSLPYNGLDFGMVICGKTLTSTQITQTERYIAQRTGVTI